MKLAIQIGLIVMALVVIPMLWVERVQPVGFNTQAMPAWSRKYNAECSLCHTTYPRLNRTGYEFKRLGYRFKWEVDAAKADKGSGGDVSGTQPKDGSKQLSVANQPGAYVLAPVTESSREGEALYKQLECNACHVIGADGGKVGPDLDGIGARRSRAFLIGHITDPEAHAKDLPKDHPQGASMPPTSASAEQIGKMVDYMLTLPEPQEKGERKTRISDYFAVSYLPGVEFENEDGTTTRTFEKRDLVIYAAGPIGRNFSFFVQPIPLSEEKGFLGKFEMMQGLVNFGGTQNFAQVRFGQIFNLRNAGFADADRGLTETLPFIFQPVNGFNPSGQTARSAPSVCHHSNGPCRGSFFKSTCDGIGKYSVTHSSRILFSGFWLPWKRPGKEPRDRQ